MSIYDKFLLVFWILLTIYIILKERESMGCNGISISHHCIDENSAYVFGTKAEPNDTKDILYKKLISSFGAYEKVAIWRRCVLIAIVYCCYMMYMKKFECLTQISPVLYATQIILVYATIQYWYFNHMNYHYHRKLKLNAEEIVNILKSMDAK